jgi:hypothetical protein
MLKRQRERFRCTRCPSIISGPPPPLPTHARNEQHQGTHAEGWGPHPRSGKYALRAGPSGSRCAGKPPLPPKGQALASTGSPAQPPHSAARAPSWGKKGGGEEPPRGRRRWEGQGSLPLLLFCVWPAPGAVHRLRGARGRAHGVGCSGAVYGSETRPAWQQVRKQLREGGCRHLGRDGALGAGPYMACRWDGSDSSGETAWSGCR